MNRRIVSFAVILCTFSVALRAFEAPAQETKGFKPFDTYTGWGQAVDLAGDCEFRHEGDSLTIIVPGAYHDLWPVEGEVNAPIVLQKVEGDFSCDVLVASVTKVKPDTVLPRLKSTRPFHAGSLVIWHNKENFVRFDRTDFINKEGHTTTSVYFHIFKEGARVAELSTLVPDQPTHLRLERRGDRVTASYREDGGKNWKQLADQPCDLPAGVEVGVSAINNTSDECSVRFEGLKIGK